MIVIKLDIYNEVKFVNIDIHNEDMIVIKLDIYNEVKLVITRMTL